MRYMVYARYDVLNTASPIACINLILSTSHKFDHFRDVTKLVDLQIPAECLDCVFVYSQFAVCVYAVRVCTRMLFAAQVDMYDIFTAAVMTFIKL